MKTRSPIFLPGLIIFLLILSVGLVSAQTNQPENLDAVGNAFTYQGRLARNGIPFDGSCDFTFGLWDAQSGGSPIGISYTLTSVVVANGVFSVRLNDAVQFGANPFSGSSRFLEISVKCPGDAGFALLGRQELTSTPYASYALTAGSVPNGVVTTGSYGDPAWISSLSAGKISGVVPLAHGGTGSATQNFVDLTSSQSMAGVKTFTSPPFFNMSASSVPFTLSSQSNLQVPYLNADLLDGQHASAFQQHTQNVIVVAKSGGDYTSIQSALSSITNASASNPYLIWVAPGIYTEKVWMKPYVDIEGAGESSTKITSTGYNNTYPGTVVGADNAELRFLTVENTGGNVFAIAVDAFGSVRLTHVTALASNNGSSNASYAIYSDGASPTFTYLTARASNAGYNNAIRLNNSLPLLKNVIAVASGGSGENYGIYSDVSSPVLMDTTVLAYGGSINYGIYDRNSTTMTIQNSVISASTGTSDGIHNHSYSSGTYTLKIFNSQITGNTSTIYSDSADFSILIGSSQLNGIGGQGPGNYTCAFSYNQDLIPLNSSTCQYP